MYKQLCYVLRPAQPNDLPELYAMEKKDMPSPWSESMMSDAIRSNDFLVLYNDSALIGFIIFSTLVEEAELLQILVDSAYRQQGVGSYLLEQGLLFLKNKNATCCFLEVRQSNAGAIALYQKFGFYNIGCRKNYYQTAGQRENALVMRVDLYAR